MRATKSSQSFWRRPWQAVASDLLADRSVTAERAIAYAAHPRLRLDVYRPRRDPDRTPIVVFLYGGAWKTGERGCYSFIGAALAARGITTVIPDYRLFPEVRYPEFNQDAAAAYAWTQRTLNAGRARPVILMGHSAGAHIATSIAYDTRYIADADPALPRPDAVIAMSGPYGFDPTTWPTTREIFATAPDAVSPRPITHVGPHCPETLLIYGLGDDVVEPENARELRDALVRAGVTARLIEYPGVGHILPVTAFLRIYRWRVPVLRDCLEFIAAITANAAAAIKTSEPAASA